MLWLGFPFFGVVFFPWDVRVRLPSCATNLDFWVCVGLIGEKKTLGISRKKKKGSPTRSRWWWWWWWWWCCWGCSQPRESITREENSIENSEPKGDENHWRRKKIAYRILNSQGGDENHWRRKIAHTEF